MARKMQGRFSSLAKRDFEGALRAVLEPVQKPFPRALAALWESRGWLYVAPLDRLRWLF